MSLSKTEPKACKDNDNADFKHQEVQPRKKMKILLKKPTFKFINNPKEIILIQGKDSACRQKFTFHQAIVSPAVVVPKALEHERDLTERDSNILPERPRAPSAVKPERPREFLVEDDDLGRNRKKPRRTLKE